MPKNNFERMVFAFLTVLITVHAYVFYSLYVINGDILMNITKTTSVLSAIRSQNGVYMLGTILPLWALILIEFVFAYSLELLIGSPLSFKMATRIFDMGKTNSTIFETCIICSTVCIMCPLMSFIAAFLYYPYYDGFNVIKLIASWAKLVILNFPFAFFTQLFFIQPLVRAIFKMIFVNKAINNVNKKTIVM